MMVMLLEKCKIYLNSIFPQNKIAYNKFSLVYLCFILKAIQILVYLLFRYYDKSITF